jgi:hypothetical protein
VDELPHRAVIDLEAALSELSHQPAYGKILPAPLHQPEVLQRTIGGQAGTYVNALDDDDEQGDRLAIEADGMLTILVDLGVEWDDTPEALELCSEDEGD